MSQLNLQDTTVYADTLVHDLDWNPNNPNKLHWTQAQLDDHLYTLHNFTNPSKTFIKIFLDNKSLTT